MNANLSTDIGRLIFSYLTINELANRLCTSKHVNAIIKLVLSNVKTIDKDMKKTSDIWIQSQTLAWSFYIFIESHCRNIIHLDISNMQISRVIMEKILYNTKKLQILILPNILYEVQFDNDNYFINHNLITTIKYAKKYTNVSVLGIKAYYDDDVIRSIANIFGTRLKGLILTSSSDISYPNIIPAYADLTIQYLIKYTNLSVLHLKSDVPVKHLTPFNGKLPMYLSILHYKGNIEALPNIENLIELDMGLKHYNVNDFKIIINHALSLQVLCMSFVYVMDFHFTIQLLYNQTTLPCLTVFATNTFNILKKDLDKLKKNRPTLNIIDISSCNLTFFDFVNVCYRAGIIDSTKN